MNTPTALAPGVPETHAWERRTLLRLLAGIVTVGLVLIGGLGYALYLALTTPSLGNAGDEGRTETDLAAQIATLPVGPERRDAIAAAPMLTVPPEASRSGTPSSQAVSGLVIPPAGQSGPVGIATGFPQTPQGAIGQLAAISVSVLHHMSIEHTREVYAAWSEPKAQPVGDWELMASVQAFHSSAAGTAATSLTPVITAAPVAAQVKGTDGQDWTLACVLLDVQARAVTSARIAFGHCERMQWQDTRWVIAAGAAPARAPSTWPGTDLAAEAGWRTWVPAETEIAPAGSGEGA